jgi:citrate lyase subunit beta/citryl-CoA lyase
MPGSNARALEKAATLPADALILDLEDAVAPDAKVAAREQVCAMTKRRPYGRREVAIRTNPLSSEWGHADLEAAARSGCDAILLPKVESAAQVDEAAVLMQRHGSPPEQTIWCMIETPLGVLNAAEIAAAHPRLACFVMGTSDLAKDLHAAHTRERLPMLTSLGLCLLAARAHGLAIVDGVHLALDDEEGLEFACRQGVELGFDGKTLIHPKQIEVANRIFAPSAAELDQAKKIIAAHSEAEKAGKGVVVVDGRLVENLHVENARRLLALAEAIKALESATAA